MRVIQPERVSALCGGSHDTRRKGQPLSSITDTVTFSGGLGLTAEGERNKQGCVLHVRVTEREEGKETTSR